MNPPIPRFRLLAALAALALPGMPEASLAAPSARLAPVWEDHAFHLPTQIAIPPDGTNRRFLLQQDGVIYRLPGEDSSEAPAVFLDISKRPLIDNAFEEGLLGIAFHPRFAENRKLYVYHTIQHPKRSRVTEFQVSANDPDKVDESTERVLLEIPQPFWNHNSGNLLFGPDGFLHIAVGDGGKRDDAARLAQNLFALNGKILRIDVDGRDGDLEYGIPADNPFAGVEGTRPEIWAYGLRNPWGIHFDSEGRFWCADVGQDLYEEINLIEKGGNYGWSFYEGLHRFARRTDEPPAEATFIEPIHEYPHTDGLSITGGVVYRGKAIPELQGHYLYGDWRFGTIWALKFEDGKVTANHVLRKPAPDDPFRPSAFCEDENGEVFVLSWGGKVYRLAP